ncbi:MAG: type II toxin-antitoxin system prevent-host-death family antitoxin [Thermoleophilia bacterium]
MEEITHRQMRNDSAEVLRRVAAGESLLVTNNGRPAAVIAPPQGDALAQLAAQGQVREARISPETLRAITPVRSRLTTAEVLREVRGDR